MVAFAVFWKNIAESGGADTLNECYIEKGSLKSFISGKGYKGTKRDHQLHALVIEILHFQSFLDSNETAETFDGIEREIFNLEINGSCDLDPSKEMHKIFKEYEEHQKKTETGINGKTGRY